ncbi:MAG: hypothetical protein AAF487_10630 [Bacteroidota bacterium]
MSSLSTQDDEILILIYENNEHLDSALVLYERQFHKGDTAYISHCLANDNLLFLIEMDTERTPNALEKIIRKNATELCAAYDSKDYQNVKDILGDEDLLGYLAFRNEPGNFLI